MQNCLIRYRLVCRIRALLHIEYLLLLLGNYSPTEHRAVQYVVITAGRDRIGLVRIQDGQQCRSLVYVVGKDIGMHKYERAT